MAKAKRGFMDGYKIYDDSQGRGSEREWRAAFNERMGIDEAEEFFAAEAKAGRRQTPFEVLGVSLSMTWAAVKTAYRRLAMQHAPDFVIGALMKRTGGQATPAERDAAAAQATERLKAINAAYVIVERDFERAGRKH